METNNIPVLLLTGYLGSGKTTLVNNILSNKKGIKFAVIVNDIGEVNIDADLIEKGGVVGKKDESLVALQNGCICCTLKMDLIEQLNDIVSQHKFDYIVIEASGICEPLPIAQTICSIPTLEEKYTRHGIPYLDCIVTVVDALRMKDDFGNGENLTKKNIEEDDLENLVIQQIEFCNIVLLNKASEVSDNERSRLKEIIRALQPKAEIIECDYGKVELDRILHTGLFDFDKTATSATWIREIEDIHDDDDDDHEHEHHHHHDEEHHHEHHHHEHHHEGGETEEYNISTFVYKSRRPFNLGRFDEFVARKMPKSVIRCKGMCYFKSEDEICYVFEQAGKQISLRDAGQWFATMPPEELEDLILRNP
ncbi:MAG: GTP-binding protein, partial [Bacteroidales bacterium]|nr:GTP-binding protein [Bacteroidales bacterium]